MKERDFENICVAVRNLYRVLIEAGYEKHFDVGVTPKLFCDLKATINSPKYMEHDRYEDKIMGIPVRIIKTNADD